LRQQNRSIVKEGGELLVIERNGSLQQAERRLRDRDDDRERFLASCIKICLINNMPDSALEGTEHQFIWLLANAAKDIPISLALFSLPELCRGERARRHLSQHYFSINDLWNSQFDALILTGTEPISTDLRNEPYWASMKRVCDWAAENTVSSIFSCLAAHACVLHFEGINRQPLSEKCFGVFDEAKVADHILTSKASPRMKFPHSRWNTINGHVLTSCGFQILTRSTEAGVNIFTKSRQSLLVHFQGHPEYGAEILFNEYKRDIRRFIRNEQNRYPQIPKGYFDRDAYDLLRAFQMRAMSDRHQALLDHFPNVRLRPELTAAWSAVAISIYRNWLLFVKTAKLIKRPQVALPVADGLPTLSRRVRLAEVTNVTRA
jgi:homoserine O-succinyltransferase